MQDHEISKIFDFDNAVAAREMLWNNKHIKKNVIRHIFMVFEIFYFSKSAHSNESQNRLKISFWLKTAQNVDIFGERMDQIFEPEMITHQKILGCRNRIK